ncbi:MAG TPA: hypothetical protein VEC11_06320 [Allosphingosinicella sp.]|nr:hypothetical protein [Allosphingosinicella sp.]
MKSVMLGMGGLCACGAWYLSDGPDFDRVVKKPPMEVYAAFSRLAQEGVVTPPDQRGPGPRVSFKVEKTSGQTIRYEIRFDDRPVVEADLNFSPAGADGRETRMTAELDIDTFELGSAFQTEAGVALSMIPDRFVDAQFARFMEHMVRDVEAGRPLPPLGTRSFGVRSASSSRREADPDYRRARAEAQQRAAVRPMSDARPMVDPNRAADRYLREGRQDNRWDR